MWQPAFAPLGVRASQVRARSQAAVVFLHGYLCLSSRAYWRGLRPVRGELDTVGTEVIIANAPMFGGVVARAERLARYLAALPHRNLILVGHSMGGLHARYVASCLDPDHRIQSVITIGTPHRGSAVAEWVLSRGKWPTPLLRLVDRGALRDLTRDRARQLDRAMPDRPDVTYRAILGRCSHEQFATPLRFLAQHLVAEEGDNDGVVSIYSAARWSDPALVNADHFGLIGQTLRWGLTWGSRACRYTHGALTRLLVGNIFIHRSGAGLGWKYRAVLDSWCQQMKTS